MPDNFFYSFIRKIAGNSFSEHLGKSTIVLLETLTITLLCILLMKPIMFFMFFCLKSGHLCNYVVLHFSKCKLLLLVRKSNVWKLRISEHII